MRSLIIRFMDCEGPGIIEDSLRKANYTITYHDAYKKGIQIVPESHQIFDIIILMGGPKSVYDPKEDTFFKPYLRLVENTISNYCKGTRGKGRKRKQWIRSWIF